MSHIFISYNSSDIDFAENLKHKIEQAGLTVWMDIERLHGGATWRGEIDQAIRSSFALVLVLTPEALQSAYVNYEWTFALGAEVTVIPVLLKPLSEPHPRLDALQHLDFTHPRNRPWNKLIERLRQAADASSPHALRLSRDTPPAIKKAVEALDSHKPDERLTALESLAQMSHPMAREALAGAVQHPIRDVRIQAALMLAQFKDPCALPGLREALDDNNKNHLIGKSLATALKDMEFFRKILWGFELRSITERLDFLAERLLRYAVVIALGEISDASIVTDLLETLRDENSYVRRISAFILGNIGDDGAVPGLLNALHDNSYRVSEIVVMALEKIGNDAAIQGLIAFLHNESYVIPSDLRSAMSDSGFKLRRQIVGTLKSIGTPEALTAVNEWKSQEEKIGRESVFRNSSREEE